MLAYWAMMRIGRLPGREADPVVSTLTWGMLLGAVAGAGLLLVGLRVMVLRRPQLSIRVLPYVRDVPRRDEGPVLRSVSSSPTTAAAGIFGPLLRSAAELVERVLGGSSSVRRRLQRAGLDRTVQEFRVEQVVWGLACFAVMAAIGLLRTLGRCRRPALRHWCSARWASASACSCATTA